jgi:hypothetical protein
MTIKTISPSRSDPSWTDASDSPPNPSSPHPKSKVEISQKALCLLSAFLRSKTIAFRPDDVFHTLHEPAEDFEAGLRRQDKRSWLVFSLCSDGLTYSTVFDSLSFMVIKVNCWKN